MFINIDGRSALPCMSEEEYNKYNFSSAVVNALYILKLSSYNLSIVPFASSIPFCFKISLSVSFKNPSSLWTLGNSPSFSPIINIAFTLWLLDLSTSPIITWSCVPGIFVKLLFLNPTFKIWAYLSIVILSSLNTNTISSKTSIIVFKLFSYSFAKSSSPISSSSSIFSWIFSVISCSTKNWYIAFEIFSAVLFPSILLFSLIRGFTNSFLICSNLSISGLSFSSYCPYVNSFFHLFCFIPHFRQYFSSLNMSSSSNPENPIFI